MVLLFCSSKLGLFSVGSLFAGSAFAEDLLTEKISLAELRFSSAYVRLRESRYS